MINEHIVEDMERAEGACEAFIEKQYVDCMGDKDLVRAIFKMGYVDGYAAGFARLKKAIEDDC